MKAETVYSVVQALPAQELARLYAMLDSDRHHIPVEKIKVTTPRFPVWTKEECTEHLKKYLRDAKQRKFAKQGKNIKIPPAIS